LEVVRVKRKNKSSIYSSQIWPSDLKSYNPNACDLEKLESDNNENDSDGSMKLAAFESKKSLIEEEEDQTEVKEPIKTIEEYIAKEKKFKKTIKNLDKNRNNLVLERLSLLNKLNQLKKDFESLENKSIKLNDMNNVGSLIKLKYNFNYDVVNLPGIEIHGIRKYILIIYI